MNVAVILTIVIVSSFSITQPYHIEYRSEKACLEAKELLDNEFSNKVRNTIAITTCSHRYE